MRTQIEGDILLNQIAKNIRFIRLCFLGCMSLFAAVLFASPVFSQEKTVIQAQTNKPKLELLNFDNSNSDPKAINIAKRLNPDFFDLNPDYMDGIEKSKQYARFISLKNDQQKRFLIVTAQGSNYFCTNYGCPFYIYEETKPNNWKQILSVQAHAVYRDINESNGNILYNLVTTSVEQAQRSNTIWMWNGISYVKVNK